MNRFTHQILLDWLHNVLWPAFDRFIATGGQTTFTTTSAWNVTYDTPLVWVNGVQRTSGTTWGSTTTVVISPAAAAGDEVAIIVRPGASSGYLPRTAASLLSDLAMNGDGNEHNITNLAPATQDHHAVRKDQVQALATGAGDATYLRKDMTNAPPSADMPMGTRKITGLGAGTDAADAVRKDQVALLDGSQAFTAAVGGVTPTTAGHLATKSYVDSTVGAGSVPNRYALFTTPGANTWTVPAGILGPVFVYARGGGGGGGGFSTGSAYIAAKGGAGGVVSATIPGLTPGQVVAYTVGGGGGRGTNGSNEASGGGGGSGGGASTFHSLVIAGGGGGGGGAGNNTWGTNGGTGGAGGVVGGTGSFTNGHGLGSYPGSGTAAGVGGSVNGGVGGARGTGSANAGAGGDGSGTRDAYDIAMSAPPIDLWPETAGAGGAGAVEPTNSSNGTPGVILIMWRE